MPYKINPTTSKLDYYESTSSIPGSEYIEEFFYTINVTNADTYPYLVQTFPIPVENAISVEVDYLAYRADGNGQGLRETLAIYGGNDAGITVSTTQAKTLRASNFAIGASLVFDGGTNILLQIDLPGGAVTWNFWVKVRKTYI